MRKFLAIAFILFSALVKIQGQNYTVVTSVNPALSGLTTGDGIYASGSSVTVTATPNSGYSFVNWTEGVTEVSTSASYNFNIAANRTLVANFSQITYTVGVTANPVAGGTVSGGGTFSSGTSVTVTASPNSGYSFVNWTEGVIEVSTSTSYNFNLSANRTLVANFSQITYTVGVTANPVAGGSVSGGGTFSSGTSVTVTASPNSGYSFVNWTEGATTVSTSASYNFNITANRTLVANFSQITYTVGVTASPVAGGTVSGGGTFSSGTSVTVMASTNSGYSFVNWTEGATTVSTSASYNFNITANRTLVANFSQITYTVGVTASPVAGGTVSGGGTFSSGTSVTVTASPNSGYSFVNWTEGATTVSTSASYNFNIAANRTLVANFSLNTYTIITSSSPAGGGTTSGGGTFNYGTSMTLVATPNANYTFVNWTEGGTTVSTNTSYSFTLSASRTLVANFSLNTYMVSTSLSPVGSGTTSGGGTFNSGTSVTVTATPNTGYVFVNWTEGGSAVSTNASYTFAISANRTLVANFSLLTYTIATSSSPALGGTTSGGGSYTYGATATVTATPATGYQFVNWTQAGSAVSTSASYAFPVSANRTLVANFSLISYTINTTSSPIAGGSTSGGGTLNYGTSATVTATPATGYQFVNWTEGGSAVSTSTSYNFTVNASRSLLANFSLINYTVSTSSSPSAGGTTSGAGIYSYGSSATVTASPATGYLFANWTEGGTVVSTNISYTFTVAGNRSVVANYSLITYTVSTASTPSAGGTTAGGGTYNPGTSATVTATPASGYLFVSWTEGGTAVSTNQNYTFLVFANRSLVATFQSISYITINTLSSPSGGGTTSGAGTFPANSQITVHATASTGYNFINWTEGGSAVSASESYTFTVTANRTIVANFSPVSYSVSTSSSPSGGGSTSGGGSYNYGNEVTVTATPAAGYQFVNWTQGGSSVSTNSSYTFTVGGNRTLVANFTLISYTVTTSSSPSGSGTTSGGGTFNYNDEVTVNATPAAGYNFVNWTQGGSSVSTSASYTFTVISGRTLVANFSQIIYTVSTSSSPAAGGSASGGGTYGSGSSATVTATPATGYLFVNWSQGGSPVSTSASYTFTVTANRTLVANFTQASYTITTSSNPVAGGTTTGGGGFNYGASVTVNSTPASGYQFTNWTEGGIAVSTTASYVFTVTTSRNLLANFSLIPKVLNLTGSGGTVLHNNDIITLGSSDAGSFLITVDANAEWTVSESSLWFKAVKESNTSLRVTYMENISVIDKTASLKVLTALNSEMQINVSQKARVSQLDVSKFENIKLYPNPAFDHVFLYFGDELTGKLRISVASMQGTLLQTKEFTEIEANQIIDLDIAGMRTGQYLIKVSNENGQKILQMIKY
jgi:uncharacterized repeat protein (TIGR02543 family)